MITGWGEVGYIMAPVLWWLNSHNLMREASSVLVEMTWQWVQ